MYLPYMILEVQVTPLDLWFLQPSASPGQHQATLHAREQGTCRESLHGVAILKNDIAIDVGMLHVACTASIYSQRSSYDMSIYTYIHTGILSCHCVLITYHGVLPYHIC